MKQVMTEVAHAMEEHHPNDRVSVVHDRGNWDKEARTAFNDMKSDLSWAHGHRFSSITARGWQEDPGLQAADMIVFETMKWVDKRYTTGKNPELRKAIRELLKINANVYGKFFELETLKLLKSYRDEAIAKAAKESSRLFPHGA